MRPLIPLEIVDRIVSWVPNSSQQRTTEMLRLAGISVSWAVGWRHLVVHSHQQLLELLLLNTLLSDSLSLIHSVSLLAWKLADNQLLVNFLIPTTPNLRIINLLIGPTFAPDHLHEILATPKPSLQLLSLRFNQNTSRRSYEPFLKGAYFDHCLDLLAQWPESRDFEALSFVQDPLPAYGPKSHLQNEGIAQPIILFRFWCITNLAGSALGRHVRRLRLRIPGRNLVGSLTSSHTTRFQGVMVGSQGMFKIPLEPFPRLEFLDLSTSLVGSVGTGLGPIVRRFPRLKHLVVDRTQLLVPARFAGDQERVDESLQAMGHTVATAGLARSAEIARLWRDLAARVASEILHHRRQANGLPSIPADTPPPPAIPQRTPAPRRRGRSAYASAPRWKSVVPGPNAPPPQPVTVVPTADASSSSSSSSGAKTALSDQRIPAKVTVIPAASRLVSLGCGTELGETGETNSNGDDDNDNGLGVGNATRARWKEQFEIGWIAGRRKWESVVHERLDLHQRALDAWEKGVASFGPSLQHDDSDSDSDEKQEDEWVEREYARLVNSRPVLVTMLLDDPGLLQGEEEGVGGQIKEETGGVFQTFLSCLTLHEVSPTHVLSSVARFAAAPPPLLCTYNHCLAHGAVVWSPDWNQLPVNLISPRPPPPAPVAAPAGPSTRKPLLTPMADLNRLFRDLRLLPPPELPPTTRDPPNPTSSSPAPPNPSTHHDDDDDDDGHHPANCAHLEGRKIWDLDRW
ncbi:hypothetical protein PCANC_09396 [Puccinia coronata f. sp. avenae]|uniref:F-box domain-containing protein n=1 Tax=Puccinia coronata f. sp. avenae TaxID=200324 RepID=A0A2N5VDD3_9BASI|nr:hypothetical protein PCANC_09396 [Puccinia coronata f. sp. avenae]